MKILNTIVYYDNRDEVQKYIESASHISNNIVDFSVVVNKNELNQLDDMVQDLNLKGISSVNILDFKKNVGYLNCMLKTIQQIDICEYDFVILSNTDIEYPQNEFFLSLIGREYSEQIGCIAPSVYSISSNSYSNPHYMNRIPRKKLRFLANIFSYPALARLYVKLSSKKKGKKNTVKRESCYVYSPHGCYMIFTKNFIRKIKGYEYGALMYSEESCIGELLIRNELKCFYDNSIEIIHKPSSVTKGVNYKKRFKLWHDSIVYILDEFYN